MTSSLRILHIDTERTWRGGEQQVVSLVEGLYKRAHFSILAAPPDSAILERVEKGASVVLPTALRNSADFFSAFRLASMARKHYVNLIHAHTSRAHSIGLMVKRLLGSRVPLVVSRRVEFPIRQGWFGNRKYRNADFYIPISQAIAAHLMNGGIGQEKIKVVHSGLDFSRFPNSNVNAVRNEFGIDSKKLIVGNIAFCERRKRQRDIIDAAPAVLEQAENVHFVIVGEGEELDVLRSRAKNLGVANHITFTGFRQDTQNFYALFDVFLMVSENEGLCNSILEAQYFGIPVVATAVGGMPEVIQHEQNGLLVPPTRPDAIADSIVRLYRDPEWRVVLGDFGKRVVLDRFSVDSMVDGTIAAYQQMLKGKVNA